MEKNNTSGEKPVGYISYSCEDRQNVFSVLELFPIPMEVFSLDGTSLFVNQAFVNLFQINGDEVIGRLNILKDPYINNNLGLSDYLSRVFAGEILSLYGLKVPFEEIDRRYSSAQINLTESDMYQDIICFPLRGEDDSVVYVIAIFMTKHVYQLWQDVMKAKEYIDVHWHEEFDFDKIVEYVGMSRYHLAHLFKNKIGMPPYSYYIEVKIQKIKEALANNSLSISQIFASCGVDYNSGFAKAFKNRVGMTPTQYRKDLTFQSNKSGQKLPDTLKRNQFLGTYSTLPINSFVALESQLLHIAEIFPIPVQIFAPNGDIFFVNGATLKMWNVLDTSLILGKYNLIKDSLVNDQFGLRDEIRRTFQGEIVLIQDIRLPLESFWDWYKTRSDIYDIEAIYTDILNFPIFGRDGELVYIVSIFFTSRIYSGRSDVARAKEYLENHWKEEFDIIKLSQQVHLSPSQLSRLFKKDSGITPYSYYQDIKINHLKVMLCDKTMSIGQAFIFCGFDYPGNCTRFFKEKTGMTPSEYRKTIEK